MLDNDKIVSTIDNLPPEFYTLIAKTVEAPSISSKRLADRKKLKDYLVRKINKTGNNYNIRALVYCDLLRLASIGNSTDNIFRRIVVTDKWKNCNEEDRLYAVVFAIKLTSSDIVMKKELDIHIADIFLDDDDD